MEKYEYLFGNNNNKQTEKYNKFYIMTIILLLPDCVFWIWELNFCTINTHIISSLILIIPIILIVLMYILTKKEKIKVRKGKIISIFLIILFLVLNFLIVVFVIVKEGTSSEDDPLKYEHISSIAGYKSLTYQFPDKISQELIESNKVKFYYTPQFLQGGFCFELLLEMDNKKIDSYIDKYRSQIREIIEVTEDNIEKLDNDYGIHGQHGIFKYQERENFFMGCNVYLLESKPYKPNDWNHGYVAYMAKNETLQQLLLVTEVW